MGAHEGGAKLADCPSSCQWDRGEHDPHHLLTGAWCLAAPPGRVREDGQTAEVKNGQSTLTSCQEDRLCSPNRAASRR